MMDKNMCTVVQYSTVHRWWIGRWLYSTVDTVHTVQYSKYSTCVIADGWTSRWINSCRTPLLQLKAKRAMNAQRADFESAHMTLRAQKNLQYQHCWNVPPA